MFSFSQTDFNDLSAFATRIGSGTLTSNTDHIVMGGEGLASQSLILKTPIDLLTTDYGFNLKVVLDNTLIDYDTNTETAAINEIDGSVFSIGLMNDADVTDATTLMAVVRGFSNGLDGVDQIYSFDIDFKGNKVTLWEGFSWRQKTSVTVPFTLVNKLIYIWVDVEKTTHRLKFSISETDTKPATALINYNGTPALTALYRNDQAFLGIANRVSIGGTFDKQHQYFIESIDLQTFEPIPPANGTIAYTLPVPEYSGVGEMRTPVLEGTAAYGLPALAYEGVGTVFDLNAPIEGTIAFSLPLPRFNAKGTSNGIIEGEANYIITNSLLFYGSDKISRYNRIVINPKETFISTY